jgi:hypothetical protein
MLRCWTIWGPWKSCCKTERPRSEPFASRFPGGDPKGEEQEKHNDKSRVQQGFPADIREPNKIAASTHYDFRGKHLTPYGGLFPVATMLEKLGFQKLVAETLTVKRIPRVMTIYQCVLGMVYLANCYFAHPS